MPGLLAWHSADLRPPLGACIRPSIAQEMVTYAVTATANAPITAETCAVEDAHYSLLHI